jgi:hypothetical protein
MACGKKVIADGSASSGAIGSGSSTSGGALFKEDMPRKVTISEMWQDGKIQLPQHGRQLEAAGKEVLEQPETSEDDTLMGRLAKRMVARDMIDSMNLGPKPKSNKAKAAMTADLLENECPSKIMIGGGLHSQMQDLKASNFSNPIPNGKVREGANMADQARNAGNVFETRGDFETEAQRSLKHAADPDTKFDAAALIKGMTVEKEHSDSKVIQKAITKAHLSEDPKYYDNPMFKGDLKKK